MIKICMKKTSINLQAFMLSNINQSQKEVLPDSTNESF